METGGLPDKEFKVMIIKMIKDLKKELMNRVRNEKFLTRSEKT